MLITQKITMIIMVFVCVGKNVDLVLKSDQAVTQLSKKNLPFRFISLREIKSCVYGPNHTTFKSVPPKNKIPLMQMRIPPKSIPL